MKMVANVGVLVFAGVAVAMTLFMPAAEVMPALVNADAMPLHADVSWIQIPGAQALFDSLSKQILDILKFGGDLKDATTGSNVNFPYYAYAVFLGLAMTAAAIAIQFVGREESEEKTILPVKK